MKKDQKRVGIYREMDLTPILIKEDELWRLIFTPFQVVKWSLISVYVVWRAVAIKPNMCERVANTSCLRLKLVEVELNFFASFNADDQRKTYVSDVSK